MDTALAVLGAVVLILAFASLFIGRRFGDRFQYRALLALGVLGIGLYAASLAAYGSSSHDWVA
jgi:putative Mn2+ efflux pump MntP